VILKCTCTCCGIHLDALQSLTGTVEVPIAWSVIILSNCRSQWPRGLWHGSAAARMLELWVRIPPGHGCWSLVKCCLLWGRVSLPGWSLDQRNLTEWCAHWVWSWILVRGNHGSESGRSATGLKKKVSDLLAVLCWVWWDCSTVSQRVKKTPNFMAVGMHCRLYQSLQLVRIVATCVQSIHSHHISLYPLFAYMDNTEELGVDSWQGRMFLSSLLVCDPPSLPSGT
jgi:hypothetical protein